MSVWTSLYTGASGLGAHSKAINVVGDNIANVSTVGFKSAQAKFGDVIANRANVGNQTTIGTGVRMNGTATQLGQGSFLSTGRALDFAISGEGFFALAGTHNGVRGDYFTRDGGFTLDQEGFVVSDGGLNLQGFSLDDNGDVVGAAGDIQLPESVPPSATDAIDVAVNLDSDSDTSGPFDPLDPENTSDFQTSVVVHDSLGAQHEVNLYFVNNGAGAWDWHATVDGAELTGGTADEQTQIANGSVSFTADGMLDTETTLASTADFVGAQPGQVLTFDFGDSLTTDGGDGTSGSTQYAQPSNLESISQDGQAAGDLIDITVAEDGSVYGVYSNGESEPLAKVALATFAAPGNLLRAADGLWSATADSGVPAVGEPGVGGRGSIVAGNLEGSNVDLGDELVTLIAYQRAFQANARTISTADEMLTEIANLKR